jgi:AraC-like DNA-binding protein
MIATNQAEYFSTQVLRTRRFYLTGWKRQFAEKPIPPWALVAGGCEWCAPDFIVERKSLPFTAFEFVARGSGWLTLGGRRLEISAGHAFFYSPAMPHVIQSAEADPLVKYFFNLSGPGAEAVLSSLSLEPGTLIRVMDASRVTALMEEVIDHALRTSPSSVLAARAALGYALVLCADSRQGATSRYDPAYSTYLRCRGHLLRNYPVLASVCQAAGHCHVSAAYMTRLFKRYDTETPLECLVRLKMSQAMVKLRTPGVQVKSVAHELGYKSPAHFSRAFKAWCGRSPVEVRDHG